jgi:adenine-specific DNA-methyltransferase
MGDYFETVLKPRIMKIVYSKDWKDGKPVSREGISHMFKYIRLESYEDALANIALKRTPEQQLLLDKQDTFRESYMLKYMLETEAKGSPSLINIDRFDDPFSYQILVGTGSVGETKLVTVDLVETFNWLLGLRVKHIDTIEGFRIVEGLSPSDEKVLVIWRKIRDLAEADPKKVKEQRQKANDALDTFFKKQQYNTLDSEHDVIYVNGDNNLMNIPLDPEKEGVTPRYKVRLIEEEFKRLMFDVKDE